MASSAEPARERSSGGPGGRRARPHAGSPRGRDAGPAARAAARGVAVAIVNFRTYDYLDACLASLKRQTLRPRQVLVADNGSLDADLARLRRAWPDVRFFESPQNRGFAAAANDLIARADPASDVLVLNADTRPGETFLEVLASCRPHPRAGVLGGLLLREDGSVDSLGIGLRRNGRAFDWRPSRSLAPRDAFEVFAISGAATFLRRELIDELRAISGECFDSRFWMYHEDLDLCWRARWLGWSCWTVPQATALHRRGWREGGRRAIPTRVRRHSFKNHYLCLVKNAPASLLLRNLPPLLFRELLRLGYALLFERDVLPAYAMALRELPAAWRTRRALRRARRAAPAAILSWVE